MKNVNTLKSNQTESPKTPGGISKSLLTPCRRVGLSRNWKKAGRSPFVSPLNESSQSNAEVVIEKTNTRKRKEPVPDETSDQSKNNEIPSSNEVTAPIITSQSIQTTPVLPCNKKSRLLANTKNTKITKPDKEIECCEEDSKWDQEKTGTVPIITSQSIHNTPVLPCNKKTRLLANTKDTKITKEDKEIECCEEDSKRDQEKKCKDSEPSKELVEKGVEITSTPVRQKSMSKLKKKSPVKTIQIDTINEVKENINNEESKRKSPNNLTKECVVVIQKKIFKVKQNDSKGHIDDNKSEKLDDNNKKTENKTDTRTVSQALFGNDSDDEPLSSLNKNKEKPTLKADLESQKPLTEVKKQPEIQNQNNSVEDDDFTVSRKVKTVKLVHKKTSTGGLNPEKNKKEKVSKATQKELPHSKLVTQNSFDDDDDFEFETKKTILIRKSYDKVSKPTKAKTTGSITQKDIDDLKSRIEMKKQVLLAKTMTDDTKELRDLIKKWQKGCQDALAELMDLMKSKCPDKKNMDYSEMLQMLKIPTNLVGYDAENDCFNTPDDTGLILSKFNDI